MFGIDTQDCTETTTAQLYRRAQEERARYLAGMVRSFSRRLNEMLAHVDQENVPSRG